MAYDGTTAAPRSTDETIDLDTDHGVVQIDRNEAIVKPDLDDGSDPKDAPRVTATDGASATPEAKPKSDGTDEEDAAQPKYRRRTAHDHDPTEGEHGDDTEQPTAPAASDERVRDEQGRFTRGGKKRESGSERIARIQAEINARTRELRETERRLAERQSEEARVRSTPVASPAETTLAARAPEPVWDEDKYDSYADFQKEHTKWIREETLADARTLIESREKTQQTQAEQARHAAAQGEHNRRYNARLAKVQQDHPDFVEAGQSIDHLEFPANDASPEERQRFSRGANFLANVFEFHDKGFEVMYGLAKQVELAEALYEAPMSYAMLETVMEADEPLRLLEALVVIPDDQGPTEAERIATLSHPAQLRALGRLEARLEGAKNGSPSRRSVSHAAPPPSHRAGSHSAGSRRSLVDEPPDVYVRVRGEEELTKRRKALGLA